MAVLINRKRLHDYTLKEERDMPESERSTFKRRALDPEQLAEVRELLLPFFRDLDVTILRQALRGDVSEEAAVSVSDLTRFASPAFVRATVDACAIGLGGWENVRDEDGNVVECEIGQDARVARHLLLMLSDSHLQELTMSILNLNTVSRADRGN